MSGIEHLCADQFGAHIGKHSERIMISCGKTLLEQAPLLHLQDISVIGTGISISTDAIRACCERDIPIILMDAQGDVYASLHGSDLVGTAQTRRAQLEAYADARGMMVAINICAAKVHSQAANARYWARNRRAADPDLAQQLGSDEADIDSYAARIKTVAGHTLGEIRDTLMGLEGSAARIYWAAAARLVGEQYSWPGRTGRGATDPLNSLLNYGYGILYAEVERALLQAGLDPYAGFLHADRAGKPSLVLDLTEEFRQAVVDRVVFGLAARQYTVHQDDKGLLTSETRRDFADKIHRQLEVKMRRAGERVPLRQAIRAQAKHLAMFLRGEAPEYTAFEAE